jgi:hypothetical protein
MGELERQGPRLPAQQTTSPATSHRQKPPPLASERVIINAPMSFAGAAQRSWRIGEHATGTPRWAVVALIIVPIVLFWWSAVLVWYVTFGLLLVPYRLLRRGARKRKAEALRHREMLEAVDGVTSSQSH